MSETRTAILLDESHKKVVSERMDEIAEIAVVKDQEAMPWCTTHNAQQSGDNYCWKSVDYDAFPNIREANCEFSQGGPDHKWWEDQ